MRAAVVLALAGCGRLGFDPAGASGDGGPSDTASATYLAEVLADQPRFLFRLDEQPGEIAHDATGHGNDSVFDTSGGMFTYREPGPLRDGNPAVLIEGDGNLGPKVAASVPLQDIGTTWMGNFTIELWFQPTRIVPSQTNGALFLCEHYLTTGFRTGVRHEMDLELWTSEGGRTTELHGTSTLALGSWSHVVFVRRGDTAEIWRDGVREAVGPLDYAPPDPRDAAVECGFGAFHGVSAYGVFDEVAVYEKALSADRIAAHHAAR